ncbi:unnamed protein product [Somion occarium]|uniref:Uncharacterized protein n=2 Tax=Somion occarium TaxID=3059160 RepID=A0ABP1DQA9_9APHY
MPPKSSSARIIIKPPARRRGGAARGGGRTPRSRLQVVESEVSSPAPTATTQEDNEEPEEVEAGSNEAASSSLLPSASQTPAAGEEQDEEDVEAADDEGAGDNASTPAEGSTVPSDEGEEVEAGAEVEVEKAPRGRGRGRGGRPRGRPRGSGTPRARGRGSRGGRGRGRGRGSFTIKLPRRTGEEGEEGALASHEEGEGEAVALEAAGAEEPMGGGKPFKTVQGKVYIIEGDELVTDDDPKGDEKIDKDGNLLGGRKFKAHTFTLPNRHPTRQYMLAIDAARTSGFRDSLYYFRRNPLAMKLNATQWEKDHLIEEGKLGSHLKTRSVTLITARSAFKLHGSKMVIGGRWVVDDYYEDKVLAEVTEKGLKPGDYVGDLSEPTQAAAAAEAAARELQAGPLGIGPPTSMYRPGGPTTLFGGSGWGPYSDGPLNAVRKSLLNREGLNEENWMAIAALRTAEDGAEWAKLRRDNLKVCGGIQQLQPPQEPASEQRGGEMEFDVNVVEEGGVVGMKRPAGPEGDRRLRKKRRFDDGPLPLGIYEPQTGVVLYRHDTQPRSARWEVVDDRKPVLGGTKVGNGAWGLAWIDTVMELPNLPPQPPPIRVHPPTLES